MRFEIVGSDPALRVGPFLPRPAPWPDAMRQVRPTRRRRYAQQNWIVISACPLGGRPLRAMQKVKTFLVEDSSIVRENLIAALEENAPIEVVGIAEDESSAISWLMSAEHSCDLVIVDIFLRAGTGLGVLKGTLGLSPGMKRVVLSNHATGDIRVKCLELGADEVFDKSNEIDEMFRYCNRLRPSLASTSPPTVATR